MTAPDLEPSDAECDAITRALELKMFPELVAASGPSGPSDWERALIRAGAAARAVPREPTPEMIEAAASRSDRGAGGSSASMYASIWRAMYDAAAPERAAGEERSTASTPVGFGAEAAKAAAAGSDATLTPAPVAQEPWDDPVDDAIVAAAEAAQPEPDALVERMRVIADDYRMTGCDGPHEGDIRAAAAALVALQQRVREQTERVEKWRAHWDAHDAERQAVKADLRRAEAELARANERVKDYSENSALFLRERDEARAELAQARKVIAELGGELARAQVGQGEGKK